MSGSSFHPKIAVELINVETNQVFAKANMEASQLPESFEKSTTLHLGDDQWTVEEAIPMHADEFMLTGKLTLKLRKVLLVSPEELLYSIPSISHQLPIIVPEAAYGNFVFMMREDDWKQFEFLPKDTTPDIEKELEKVQEIWDAHSQLVDENWYAFKKLHVRTPIAHASLGIKLADFTDFFGIETIGSVSFHSGEGYVKNGFSAICEEFHFYGILQDGHIEDLCIDKIEDFSTFTAFLLTHNLVLVDWCSCEIITG